ncbi:MAG: ATP-binding protein [Roseateles asaccharophilus]|uniref:ATP-binding protein n=1 Tax=Roseateles asaccharophilus TaxID=582607 RepID=UPI0010600FE3|nr:ATP-binding protein [Roseateles asaccharophilus]MDN3543165.1 ATP-binding protein [Roseateles asaccharophilus]
MGLSALQHTELDLPLRIVQTLVLYALGEHQLGHARRIVVNCSGTEFSVSDDGRGHSVSRTVEGAPYLDFIYGHLAFPFGRADSPPVQLQGLGISLLNQLCESLDVTVRKSTQTLRLRFGRGTLLAHQLVDEQNLETGNCLAGEVLAGLAAQAMDVAALVKWLSAVQEVNPGLELVLNGKPLRAEADGA